MSAQGPQFHGTKKKYGEEGRFRENTAAQTPLPTRGQMFTRPLPGGRSLELRRTRSATTSSHPFKVTTSAGDESGSIFRVEPGTFGGVIPTLGGVSLNLSPTSELGNGDRFVYLKATFSLSTENDYVYAGTPTAVIVEVKTAEETNPLGPKGPGSSADFYILLATFEDGVKTGQYIISSLGYEVCGTADDTGRANLVVVTS